MRNKRKFNRGNSQTQVVEFKILDYISVSISIWGVGAEIGAGEMSREGTRGLRVDLGRMKKGMVVDGLKEGNDEGLNVMWELLRIVLILRRKCRGLGWGSCMMLYVGL